MNEIDRPRDESRAMDIQSVEAERRTKDDSAGRSAGDARSFRDRFGDPEDIPEAVYAETGPPVDEDAEAIQAYIDAVGDWKNAEGADNAVLLERNRARRQEAARMVLDQSLAGSEKLKPYQKYLAADIASLNPTTPSDGEFAQFLRRKGQVISALFGENDKIDAESYARAIARVKAAVVGGVGITEQYEFLDARREAVLEHWNDPEFIAGVAQYKDNHLRDELFADFDRKDLEDVEARIRSRIAAKIYREKVDELINSNLPTAEIVRKFAELRGMGEVLLTDQGAIMDFVRDAKGLERGSYADERAFEVGMMALAPKTYTSADVIELYKAFPKSERERIIKETKGDIAALFSHARQQFEKDIKSGNRRALSSFVVMERAASRLRDLGGKNVQRLSEANIVDAEVFNAFTTESDSGRPATRSARKRGADFLEEEIVRRLQEGPSDKAPWEGLKAVDSSLRSREEIEEILRSDDLRFEAVDGSHVKIVATRSALAPGSEFARAGLGPEAFEKLAAGEISPKEYLEKAREKGFDEERLKSLGIDKGLLYKVPRMSAEDARDAFRELSSVSRTLRLKNVATPPEGVMTKDGRIDAGVACKEHMEELLVRYRAAGLHGILEERPDGEIILDIEMGQGALLSNLMIRDGYAIPHKEEAGVGQEKLAQVAESQQKGLWEFGFPEEEVDWRRDMRGPRLGKSDRGEKLSATIGECLVVDARSLRRNLSDPDVPLFALSVDRWSDTSVVDGEISRTISANPARIRKLYHNNMEVLAEVRDRFEKKGLTEKEKLAHDRLEIGRRALAQAMVAAGMMTPEEAARDHHKLLSMKAKAIPEGLRRATLKVAQKTTETAEVAAKSTIKGAGNLIQEAMGFAMGE